MILAEIYLSIYLSTFKTKAAEKDYFDALQDSTKTMHNIPRENQL